MSDPITLSRYAKSDRAEVLKFLPTVFPTERVNRLTAQWDWKYDGYPFNPDGTPFILLLRDGGQIIGMLASLTLRISVRGDEYLGGSGCDAVVHPAYRGRRLFGRLIDAFGRHFRMGIGWGNPASNHVWADATTGNTQTIPLITSSLLHGHRLGSVGEAPTGQGVRVSEIERFDGSYDALWQSVRGDYPVLLIRDQRYLNWRFCERPDQKYTRLCATRGNELLGYLVIRIAERSGTRIGYLVDWMIKHQSTDVLAALVRHASAYIRRERAWLMIARTTAPAFRRTLHHMGFVPQFWGQREYAITQVTSQEEKFQIVRDIRQWYSMMGDGDLEICF